MIFVQPDRRRAAAYKVKRCKSLWLALSVISRHREIIRAQWWVGGVRHKMHECFCQLWVMTGLLKFDKDGHAWRNSWARSQSFVHQERINQALQQAFINAGIREYKVENEELALRALAEYMGYMDYFLVRHGYEENYNIPGRAKAPHR